MEEKKENNNIWFIIGGVAIFVLVILAIGVSFVFKRFKETEKKSKEIFGEIQENYNKAREKVKDSESQSIINDFNRELEEYNGTNDKNSVIEMIDKLTLSNNKNKEHQITVLFNNKEYKSVTEIVSIKKELTETNYEIIINYDENGYINKVTITL